MEFLNVKAAVAKANVYFDGKVVSHSIFFQNGEKKTLGVIYPGSYHFGTEKAEVMDITDGECIVTLDGTNREDAKKFSAGDAFLVPANSGFTIIVVGSICQYICSYIE